jgi:hypothetical protein
LGNLVGAMFQVSDRVHGMVFRNELGPELFLDYYLDQVAGAVEVDTVRVRGSAVEG